MAIRITVDHALLPLMLPLALNVLTTGASTTLTRCVKPMQNGVRSDAQSQPNGTTRRDVSGIGSIVKRTQRNTVKLFGAGKTKSGTAVTLFDGGAQRKSAMAVAILRLNGKHWRLPMTFVVHAVVSALVALGQMSSAVTTLFHSSWAVLTT